jgi:anti-anti-sigma regulatory factor
MSFRAEISPTREMSLATVAVLARLQLAAKRSGRELRLVHASDELLDLIELTGLGDALRVEARRQAEEREEPLGVEEEGEVGDAAV